MGSFYIHHFELNNVKTIIFFFKVSCNKEMFLTDQSLICCLWTRTLSTSLCPTCSDNYVEQTGTKLADRVRVA